MNPILNIAGYKFIELSDLLPLNQTLQQQCDTRDLKGTILLSEEGININLAGLPENIVSFKTYLATDPLFADIHFRQSFSSFCPFDHLRIKIKEEIITMRTAAVNPAVNRAPLISPQELQNWMNDNKALTLLDARNEYEVKFGHFQNAIHLSLKDFHEFPHAIANVPKDKPIVTYCTGGIRCEKAALFLLQSGFTEVYQLEGGILNYLAETDGRHFSGECFVFDQRIALNENLQPSGVQQCTTCEGPVKFSEKHICL